MQGLDAGTAALAVAAVGLLQGVATGLVVAPNQTLTLAHAPVGAAGVAAGFYQLSQRFAAALCSAAAAGMFLQAHGAPGEASKDAFHQGIVMCCILLGVALLAGGIDWLREARDRTKTSAAVVTSGREAATTAAVLTPEGTQRSAVTESVEA